MTLHRVSEGGQRECISWPERQWNETNIVVVAENTAALVGYTLNLAADVLWEYHAFSRPLKAQLARK